MGLRIQNHRRSVTGPGWFKRSNWPALVVWASACSLAMVAGALLADQRSESVPRVRLLYGTRRERIDVPRQPPRKERPGAPVRPKLEPVRQVPSQTPPIDEDDDEEGVVAEPERRESILERWRAGRRAESPEETPADADETSQKLDDATSGLDDAETSPADQISMPPAAVSEQSFATEPFSEPLDELFEVSSPVEVDQPFQPAEPAVPPVTSPPAVAHRAPVAAPPPELPDRRAINDWLIVTGTTQALGTTAGVLLGFLFSVIMTLVVFRRLAGRLDRVVRVEVVNSPGLIPDGRAILSRPLVETALAAASGPTLAVVDFAEGDIPLPPPAGTWHDQREAARREAEKAEQGILKAIYEENIELRETIGTLEPTAS